MAIFRNLCACLSADRPLPVRVPVFVATATGRRTQTGQAQILILKIRGCIQSG